MGSFETPPASLKEGLEQIRNLLRLLKRQEEIDELSAGPSPKGSAAKMPVLAAPSAAAPAEARPPAETARDAWPPTEFAGARSAPVRRSWWWW